MNKEKKPYRLYLDKGYERHSRRRKYKKENCQIKMEMKNMINASVIFALSYVAFMRLKKL